MSRGREALGWGPTWIGRLGAAVRREWDALALLCAGLLLYAATAAPSVATIFDDSLEFQVVLPTLGIAHPSGYPLYTLLGRLATLVFPFRDPAGRVNLFSALAAGLAVGLLYLTARRLAGSRPAAAVATVAFALSPAWWSQATIAEVYALHGLLMILFIYLLLRRSDRPSTFHLLPFTFLVFGLGLAHHRMIVLLLPAALILSAWTAICDAAADKGVAQASSLRYGHIFRWALLIVAGLAPLLLYAYLPIRGRVVGSLDGTFQPTLQGTLDWIFARGYSVFLTGNPFGVERNGAFFVALFLKQLGALPVLAALIGLATAWRFGSRRYVFLLVATLAQIAFGVVYKVQDVEVFFIPAFMLIALWAALGLAPVFDALAVYAAGMGRALHLPRRLAPFVLGGATLLVAAVILAEPLAAARRDWANRDLSRKWDIYDHGQDILAAVAPGGRVVGLLGETTLVRYFRDVLGRRTDVTVVPADREADRFAAVDAALAAGVPVYLTRELPGAAGRYSLDAAGPLIAVSPKAAPATPAAGRPVAPGILLADVQTIVRQTHAGPVARVVPVWVAAAPIGEELKVSARLLDAAGRPLAQNDRVPVHFAYPTTAWVVGEEVRDCYDLAVPQGAGPGPYRALLIWYRAADGGEVGRVEVTVPSSPSQPPAHRSP
ncbi:MAG: glycosyltransferase family 117 protein [Anaerolineae bacterium]